MNAVSESKAQDVWEFTEDPPMNVWDVSDLWHWSTNYDPGKGPFTLFLDLIGYSYEEFGENLYDTTGDYAASGLGYVELDKLARALSQYALNPRSTRAWIEELMSFDES